MLGYSQVLMSNNAITSLVRAAVALGLFKNLWKMWWKLVRNLLETYWKFVGNWCETCW